MGRQFVLYQDRSALYLRSVCLFNIVFRGVRCHPLPCMSLKLRFTADSNPSLSARSFLNLSSKESCKHRAEASHYRLGGRKGQSGCHVGVI